MDPGQRTSHVRFCLEVLGPQVHLAQVSRLWVQFIGVLFENIHLSWAMTFHCTRNALTRNVMGRWRFRRLGSDPWRSFRGSSETEDGIGSFEAPALRFKDAESRLFKRVHAFQSVLQQRYLEVFYVTCIFSEQPSFVYSGWTH